MTRYKDLRRLEKAIANRDKSELKWASEWCKQRLSMATVKHHQNHWRRLQKRVDIAFAELECRAIPKQLPGKVSVDVRQALLSFLNNTGSEGSIICLLFGSEPPNPEEGWTYGIYEPENVCRVSDELQELGYPLLYEIDGLTFAIPQFDRISEITGKTMVLSDGQLVFE